MSILKFTSMKLSSLLLNEKSYLRFEEVVCFESFWVDNPDPAPSHNTKFDGQEILRSFLKSLFLGKVKVSLSRSSVSPIWVECVPWLGPWLVACFVLLKLHWQSCSCIWKLVTKVFIYSWICTFKKENSEKTQLNNELFQTFLKVC